MAIKNNEVLTYQAMYLELNRFSEDPAKLYFSEEMPPELVASITALGTGAIGVGAFAVSLSGLSGAAIVAFLTRFGIPGLVGGIASVAITAATAVAVPAMLMYKYKQQKKFQEELKHLFKVSEELEGKLTSDERSKVKDLIKSLQEYRRYLIEKHTLQYPENNEI